MSTLIHIDGDDWLGDVDERAWRRILEKRGGCSCCISPPCYNCTEPIKEHELNEFGYTYEKSESAAPSTPPMEPGQKGGA